MTSPGRSLRETLARLSAKPREPTNEPKPDAGFWISYLCSVTGRRCEFGTTRPLTVDETIRFAKGIIAIAELMIDDVDTTAGEREYDSWDLSGATPHGKNRE